MTKITIFCSLEYKKLYTIKKTSFYSSIFSAYSYIIQSTTRLFNNITASELTVVTQNIITMGLFFWDPFNREI